MWQIFHLVYFNWFCNVYGRLKTGFKLAIGFITNLQIVTTINYDTINDLHSLQSFHTNLFSLFALAFMEL
jgi:hypothetical protein